MVKKTRNKAGFFMSFTFSKNLIGRTVDYFKETYEQDISEETANEHLRSLSAFYLAFVPPAPEGGGQKEQGDCSVGASNTHRTL